ncbi:MAG: hypothetical protein ABJA37_02080 [Ferruginibacter sp.]
MLNKNALLLAGAGLAVYAAYKYSKMSETEKNDLVNSLKEKGRKLADKYVPEDIKNKFTTAMADTENSFKSGF